MKVSLEKLGLNLTKEEAINNMMRDWPDMIVVTVQHAIGAMFCIPSLLGV